jgi:hypothetical protein
MKQRTRVTGTGGTCESGYLSIGTLRILKLSVDRVTKGGLFFGMNGNFISSFLPRWQYHMELRYNCC